MRGPFEVFQNLTPFAVFAGAATMALVHDDEIEEFWAELLVSVLVVVVGQPLVERQVDIVSGIDLLVLDDRHCLFERTEVSANSLINERGAISQVTECASSDRFSTSDK